MAGEIQIRIQLSFAKGGVGASFDPGSLSLNMAGSDYNRKTQVIGIVEEPINAGEVVVAGSLFACQNLDLTNTVSIRLNTGSTLNWVMPPGEVFYGRVGANPTQIFAMASVAPCRIDYLIVSG